MISEAVDLTHDCCLELAGEVGLVASRVRLGGVGLVFVQLRPGQQNQVEQCMRKLAGGAQPSPPVVVIDVPSPEVKLDLMRAGAVDCLSRPLNLSRLAFLVDVLTVRARFSAPITPSKGRSNTIADRAATVENFLYESAAMRAIVDQAVQVAPLSSTVLLNGETGTGKTHLARLIHEISPRKGRPFVVVNCGALPPTLIESEMFGHVRGSFTGADRDHRGKFAQAEDGTLLLDEVDSLPFAVQAKLLRAVEERMYEPVGSSESLKLQARLVAASNAPLEVELAAGRFRSDLYYRLNVIALQLPPLRQRREEIGRMADKFLAEFSSCNGRRLNVTPAARSALVAYDWPGNIRELRNVIERCVALCAGPHLDVHDLPDALRSPAAIAAAMGDENGSDGNQLAQARKDAECRRLMEALERNQNNRSRAASELGVSRVTLYKKLSRFGLR